MLEHGGRLRRAVRRYGGLPQQWIDLSTGINPQPWSGVMPPPASWARLPEDDDGLVEAARRYYGAAAVLPVAGSQAAIQALPHLRPPCRVGLLVPLYAEHEHCWRRAGHQVIHVAPLDGADASASCDVLVVANPNNPDGRCIPRATLLDWHRRLAARGGWLVVDEAFADVGTTPSVAAYSAAEGLVVLRSFGKFFGLAGIRLGFVLAHPQLLSALGEWLGPWAVAGPARQIGIWALQDRAWQRAARTELAASGQRLASLLGRGGLVPAGGCALFQWVPTDFAAEIHERLAQRRILSRLFEQPAGLRIGLPPDEAGWAALEDAMRDEARQRLCA
jgi:cobalamin biosynthetic protein CobC